MPVGILVYRIEEDHLRHLHIAVSTIRQHQLKAKIINCSFGTDRVIYLGHVMGQGRVSMQEDKISSASNWKHSQTAK